MELKDDHIVKINDSLTWRVVAKNMVVLNLDSSEYYTLNETGTALWQLFEKDIPVSDIKTEFCNRFDVAYDSFLADLVEFVEYLVDNALVSLSHPSNPNS